jgi:hypothetical protein
MIRLLDRKNSALGLLAIASAIAFYTSVIANADRRPSARSADIELVGQFSGHTISAKASAAYGGAIYSLRWGGKEFINSFDKGRELQSAVSFNGLGECYNPTEAGSDLDATGPKSTSRLLRSESLGTELKTRSQMAFWLQPGQSSPGCPRNMSAQNSARLSNIVLSKNVQLAAAGISNAIDHNVTFSVPRTYETAVFEALTAYLQPDFSQFWTFDPASGQRKSITDGPGEQNLPLIFSTPSHQHAFGVYSSELPQRAWQTVGYARFRFTHLKAPGSPTVKWNCVFREKDIKPGDYSYRCTSIFGTLQDVETAMMDLHRIRGRKAN